LKLFPQSQEWNKGAQSLHFYSGTPSQSSKTERRNKRNTNN
jgi:hypothetical protein